MYTAHPRPAMNVGIPAGFLQSPRPSAKALEVICEYNRIH